MQWLMRLCLLIGGGATLLLMLHVCADIVLREAFGVVLPGTLEVVSYFYMTTAVCLAFPAMQLTGQQVIVEVFLQKTSEDTRRVFDIVASCLTTAYVAFLAAGTGTAAWSAMLDGEMQLVGGHDLITWPGRWLVFAGFACTALVVIWQVWAQLRRQPHTIAEDTGAVL